MVSYLGSIVPLSSIAMPPPLLSLPSGVDPPSIRASSGASLPTEVPCAAGVLCGHTDKMVQLTGDRASSHRCLECNGHVHSALMCGGRQRRWRKLYMAGKGWDHTGIWKMSRLRMTLMALLMLGYCTCTNHCMSTRVSSSSASWSFHQTCHVRWGRIACLLVVP